MTPRTVRITAPLVAAFVLDAWTKSRALRGLAGPGPRDVSGGLFASTPVLNPGTAFGWGGGPVTRWVLVGVGVTVLVALAVLAARSRPRDALLHVAVGVLAGGTLGNLRDRTRWDRGVVDPFGPVDLGVWRYPAFNVADVAITTGAVLLVVAVARARAARPPESPR